MERGKQWQKTQNQNCSKSGELPDIRKEKTFMTPNYNYQAQLQRQLDHQYRILFPNGQLGNFA